MSPRYAIREAAANGHAEVVALLLAEPLERGIDPSMEDNEIIREAAAEGRTAVVSVLLSQGTGRGIDPSVRDNYPIRAAAANGHVEVVALLLAEPRERGIAPGRSANNNFAIRYATYSGNGNERAMQNAHV